MTFQQGTVDVAAPLTNSGTLDVQAGTLRFGSGSLTNLSGTTLTGGTFLVSGTLYVPGGIQTIAADLVLSGGASAILINGTGADALAGLAAVAAGGFFSVQSGHDFITAGDFTNTGRLEVGANTTFQVRTTGCRHPAAKRRLRRLGDHHRRNADRFGRCYVRRAVGQRHDHRRPDKQRPMSGQAARKAPAS